MEKDCAGSRHRQGQGRPGLSTPFLALGSRKSSPWPSPWSAASPPTWRVGSEWTGGSRTPAHLFPWLETGGRQRLEREEGARVSGSLAWPLPVKHLEYLEMDDRFLLKPPTGSTSRGLD